MPLVNDETPLVDGNLCKREKLITLPQMFRYEIPRLLTATLVGRGLLRTI